jgi:hypothetical protein
MSSGKVFLSYRRDDTAGYAGRLFDRLHARFRNRIFMDVVGLEPGADFAEEIDQAVGSCQVLIALIGKQWLTIQDVSGRRRLDRSDDFVRLEIATALRRNIRVIPVLIGDAALPNAESLPRDLARLCRRQALRVTDTNFDYDVERLVRVVRRELGGSRQLIVKPLRALSLPAPVRRIGLALAIGSALVVAVIQFAPHTLDNSAKPETTASGLADGKNQIRSVEIRLSDDGVANVLRDGKSVGVTPLSLSGRFGERIDVTLKRAGFKDWQQTLQISERRMYLVSMEREE